jgi:hypothetical protein
MKFFVYGTLSQLSKSFNHSLVFLPRVRGIEWEFLGFNAVRAEEGWCMDVNLPPALYPVSSGHFIIGEMYEATGGVRSAIFDLESGYDDFLLPPEGMLHRTDGPLTMFYIDELASQLGDSTSASSVEIQLYPFGNIRTELSLAAEEETDEILHNLSLRYTP